MPTRDRRLLLPDRIAVVYPDYQGVATATGFDVALRAALPGAKIVAAVNAVDEAGVAALSAAPGTTIVHTDPGFNAAVLGGLEAALALDVDAVVRLDTAEHDLARIPRLVEALGSADLVVFDLSFDDTTVVADTADSYHNLHVMPLVTAHLTGGALRLSGAHGYMGFRAPALREVLDGVRCAWTSTGVATADRVMWGADTALAIAVELAGFDVEVIEVPAVEMRNRPETKAAAQLRDTLALHAASLGR